jgi:hypothetical protein
MGPVIDSVIETATRSETKRLAVTKFATIAFIVVGVCVAIYAITVDPNGPIDPTDATKMIGFLP